MEYTFARESVWSETVLNRKVPGVGVGIERMYKFQSCLHQ